MAGGCTAGAKRIANRYYLFKNRDLIWKDFTDSAVFDNDVFLVEGVDVKTGQTAGASFGLNKWGLSAANTTVLVNHDAAYDFLMERVLRECDDIESAFELVSTEIDAGFRYQWANFVLADSTQVAAVEISSQTAEIEIDHNAIVRTNHHLLLPTAEILRRASPEAREAGGPLHDSQKRRQNASRVLASARSLTDVMQLLSMHSDGRGFDSICRHYPSNPRDTPFQGWTAYSYIVEAIWDKDSEFDIQLHVAQGTPCSNTYFQFPIDFSLSSTEKRDIVSEFP